MSKVIDFEPFKNSKKWDEEYNSFLTMLEKYFIKDKGLNISIDAEHICKRLYYTIRYLEGTARVFMILTMIGVPLGEFKRGKQFLIEWLEDILENLKQY